MTDIYFRLLLSTELIRYTARSHTR